MKPDELPPWIFTDDTGIAWEMTVVDVIRGAAGRNPGSRSGGGVNDVAVVVLATVTRASERSRA